MKQTQRQSNIELLRIVLILGVIILHINNKGMGGAFNIAPTYTINGKILYMLEALFICAVNTFIIITGYFMYDRFTINFVKPIGLLLKLIIFHALIYILHCMNGEAFSRREFTKQLLPTDYFIILYIVLMFISPFINIILNKLNKRDSVIFFIIMTSIFSIWATLVNYFNGLMGGGINSLSPVSSNGDGGGYTIVNFMLLYIIGALIRKSGIEKKLNTIWVAVGLIINTGIIFAIMIYVENRAKPLTIYNYDTPFAIINAICFFILFYKMNIGYNKIINFFSKGCLGVYILQFEGISKFNIQRIVESNPLIMVIKIVLTAIIIYFVCFWIDFLYNIISSIVSKYLIKKHNIDKYKISIFDEK